MSGPGNSGIRHFEGKRYGLLTTSRNRISAKRDAAELREKHGVKCRVIMTMVGYKPLYSVYTRN